MEAGGSRNYEVHKDKEKTEEESAVEKEQDEKEDPMRALENRVLDSQREMADWDNLEEIQAMNRKHIKLLASTGDGFDADAKALLEARQSARGGKETAEEELNEHGITEEEESLVKSIQFGCKKLSSAIPAGEVEDVMTIVRLNEEDEKEEEQKRKKELEMIQQRQIEMEQKAAVKTKSALPAIKVKRKKILAKGDEKKKKKPKIEVATAPTTTKEEAVSSSTPSPRIGGLASLLGAYGSDSD
jgi:hypothetical protein